ncbi:cytidine deaminase [Anaerocolumna sedimenticola]|uniref:Cytidine deaminase n=1 Tax=Anaerocolumna sedimenticola TaxID=2696063 RepID=A0A6P1TM24_9FIRM|nr:cytidine deaminase [Anaerocolumna sedimenticola]QHQ61001.1 cytidine deaminase [Anaerocolumna sedimenticola]
MNTESNHVETNELVCRKQGELIQNIRGEKPVSGLKEDTCRQLIREAIHSLKFSYSPYSGFKVGAALLTKDLKIYTGCNIENAAYSPTNCAERTAFFKAVSEGKKDFQAIAIVGGKDGIITDYCPPCGVCRQVMMEFCEPKNFFVILAKSEADYWIYNLEDMIPMGFGPGNLAQE